MNNLTSPHAYATATGAANQARERNPDCIEMTLKNIEADLSEALNSAGNLADKLRGAVAQDPSNQTPPAPTDVMSRLQAICNGVRVLNQQLGHAHNAISG